MRIDLKLAATLGVLVALSGCEQQFAVTPEPLSKFGDANRQTMLAQIVDPAPEYDDLNPPTSAEHAGQAAERYRSDKVKQPKTTSVSSSAGSSGSGGGGS